MTLMQLKVGEPWFGGAGPDGMTAIMQPIEAGLSIMLAMAVNDATTKEIKDLRRGPIKIAVLPSSPLTWLLVSVTDLTMDAPFAVGLHSEATEMIERARNILDWPPNLRGLIQIVIIDKGVIRGLRAVSLSQDWWAVFARSVIDQPTTLTRIAYMNAVERDLANMTTPTMLGAATIIEKGGAL